MPSTTLQWLSLVGVIWLQSINGTNTDFPAYSSQLKRLLSLSQLQLNNLAFASDAGKVIGWLAGIAAIYLPLWVVLLIGSLLGLIGYGVQYLFITNQISSLSYSYIFLLTVLAGNSICWVNTVCYIVVIRNFPSDRQVAVGLTTSYLGLCAKIYTDIVDVVSPISPIKRAKTYLLLNSILPLLVCVVGAPMVRDIHIGKGKSMKAGFVVMFFITVATGIYAVLSSLGLVSSGLSPIKNIIGTGVFLLAPLVIPLAEKIREVWFSREKRVYVMSIEDNVGIERVEVVVKGGEDMREVHEVVIREVHDQDAREVNDIGAKEEIGPKLMLKKVDFWLYFFIYLFGATLGLVFLNNLGQIAESHGYSRTSSLVSLSSSFGFFGRLVPSLLDYFFSRSKYMISRPASIVASTASMAGAFFLLLNGTNLSLYISTAIIGLCTGAITTLSVSTTTELFGITNFGVNHNLVVANIPIGSFLFGYLAAFVYNKEGNEDGKCIGTKCYKNTFIIWGSLCFLGTLLALILYTRTRKFYSHRLSVRQ